MTGDNTAGQKTYRAYKRAVLAKLEGAPISIQQTFITEYEELAHCKVVYSEFVVDVANNWRLYASNNGSMAVHVSTLQVQKISAEIKTIKEKESYEAWQQNMRDIRTNH